MQTKLKVIIRGNTKADLKYPSNIGITEDSLELLKTNLVIRYGKDYGTLEERMDLTNVKVLEVNGASTSVVIVNVIKLIESTGPLIHHLEYYGEAIGNNLTIAEYNPSLYLKPIDEDKKLKFIEAWCTGRINGSSYDRLLITHKDCHDGVGTAVVVGEFECIYSMSSLDPYDTMLLQYDDFILEEVLEAVKDKIVYIGDYNFPIDVFKQIEKASAMVVMVDHHLSPFKDGCGDLDNVHLDLGRSGATLTHEFFFPNTNIPLVLSLIEDRDIWNFFIGDLTSAFDLYLRENKFNYFIPYTQTTFSNILDYDFKTMNGFLEPYLKQLKVKRLKDEDLAKDVSYFTIDGVRLVGKNLTRASSEVLNIMTEDNGCPSLGWEIKDDVIRFSLRNYKDDISVEDLAKLFGGGGHKQASGFSIHVKDVDLEEFFINRNVKLKGK